MSRQAKDASQDLQDTMDRVEKVVYWYNCLQQYLKASRNRLELLDPVGTDVVDVAKQLKHCKVIPSYIIIALTYISNGRMGIGVVDCWVLLNNKLRTLNFIKFLN